MSVRYQELHMLRKVIGNVDKYIKTLRNEGLPAEATATSIARHLERILEDEV